MFTGFLSLGGMEVLNTERTRTYVDSFAPGIEVRCGDCDGLHNALADAPYQSPALDSAPWYRAVQPDTGDFYGLMPTAITGIDDSTREVSVTELSGDGAALGLARHKSREVRVRGLMIARTEQGMNAGMTWLRTTLAGAPCGEPGGDCGGRELSFFTACPGAATVPVATALAAERIRVMYRVDILDGVRVIADYPSKAGRVRMVEFVLAVGVPWAFRPAEPAATTTNVVGFTAPEVYCQPRTDAYDALVTDPSGYPIARPPRPPLIEPVTMPTSWTRYALDIGANFGERLGALAPVVTVTAGSLPRRMVRVRFYRSGAEVCDYEGEFLVTYIPAGSVLTIDGRTRDITVNVAGTDVPAGNLVIGSNGRPVTWPELSCNTTYRIEVDSQGALGDAAVLVELASRE